MRSLRRMVLIAVVVCGAGSARAQSAAAPKLKRDPKSLDETMVWLRDSIRQTAGFTLAGDSLRYELPAREMCRLSWRAVAAGGEDLPNLYPGVEQEEQLKAIVPESVRVMPVDVQGLLAGETGIPAASAANLYWKITASYVDGSRVPADAFGFVFADMQTAQRIAAVLAREAGACEGTKTLERETDIGCESAPTLKLEVPPPNGVTFSGKFTNHTGMAISCVFEANYYTENGIWKRIEYLRLDLAASGSAWGNTNWPVFLDAAPHQPTRFQCFPQESKNVLQHACAELRHPTRMDAQNEPAKKQK